VTSAAIYARVPGARQKKDQTIGSQTAALRDHARQLGAELPEEWVFEDEGHSGATLVRPALEALRDLAAQGCVDVVLCYSPDRLARKFAYQALLIEEFARAGVRVEFVRGPRGDTPEDQLLVQFQGMFAEYEKAQLMERYRRGKACRARAGSVNVLSGAPFGYRYVRKSDHAGAAYEIVGHEAALVAELFRRYADDGASIADLARWLTSQGAPTRTGKTRWDRSVVWAMLRNPAYAGTAVFGKTMTVSESPALNRVARLQGRATPRAVKTVDRPKEEWTQIPVPSIVTEDTFERASQRLEDNKRFAARNTKVPSLLQGLAACSACGYGYYRTSARTTSRKIYYYRCPGSDDYRYEGGRVCGNKPVRADYLDQVVWDHITGLLAGPALIRAEIDKRLQQARTADPAARQHAHLELALAKASTAITAMIEAFQEQLITIDELRSRMPGLRARETGLRAQIGALDAQLADRESYLKLADDLAGFLAQLRGNAGTATTEERQRVLRLLVKDVLIGPEKITIRHRIPIRERTAAGRQPSEETDTEGDHRPGYPLRWGRA
jgi:site-specific DNA recombinase